MSEHAKKKSFDLKYKQWYGFNRSLHWPSYLLIQKYTDFEPIQDMEIRKLKNMEMELFFRQSTFSIFKKLMDVLKWRLRLM